MIMDSSIVYILRMTRYDTEGAAWCIVRNTSADPLYRALLYTRFAIGQAIRLVNVVGKQQ